MNEILVLAAVAAVAAILQGSVGLGFGLVLVPALSIIEPDAVPVVPLLLALPIVLVNAIRERTSIDFHGVGWLLVGRTIGTAPGLLVVTAMPLSVGQLVVALSLIAAAVITLRGTRIAHAGNTAKVLAGCAAGIGATVAAVSGPFLALVYHGRPGPQVRSNLAAVFLFGLVVSLGGLGLAGKIGHQQIRLAAVLAAPVGVALWASRFLIRRLNPQKIGAAISVLAGVSGVVLLVRLAT